MIRRGRASKFGFTIESIFVSFALLLLTASLDMLLYGFGGSSGDSATDSNVLRLACLFATYSIGLAFLLRRPDKPIAVVRRSPLLIFLFLLPLISIAWSIDVDASLRRSIAFFLTSTFCLYLFITYSPEQLLRKLLYVFFWGGLLSILLGLLFPRYGIHADAANAGAWKGIYGHKVELGRISVIAIIVVYYCRPRTRLQTYARLATIPMFFVLLLLSQSRANWFALAGCIAIVPVLGLLRNRHLSIGLRVSIVTFAAFLIAVAASIGAEELLSLTGRDMTFSGRQRLWRAINEVIAGRFPILGAGYGAFFSESGAMPFLRTFLTNWEDVPNHAHNGFLNVRAELGIPGVVLLSVVLGVAVLRLITLLISQPRRRVWLAYSCLLLHFVVNNYSASTAFKHSDISWVLFLLAYFYSSAASSLVRFRARRRRPMYPPLLVPR